MAKIFVLLAITATCTLTTQRPNVVALAQQPNPTSICPAGESADETMDAVFANGGQGVNLRTAQYSYRAAVAWKQCASTAKSSYARDRDMLAYADDLDGSALLSPHPIERMYQAWSIARRIATSGNPDVRPFAIADVTRLDNEVTKCLK